jgi:PIN domain nuclease of toxin-antitoxin system
MTYLLDTHVVLWALADDPSLSARHRAALSEPDARLHVSAASVWEVAIKRALGKLVVPDDLFEVALKAGCIPLPISWAHAAEAGALPPHHADPFDRMLIAQARCEGLTLLSADSALAAYDVARI